MSEVCWYHSAHHEDFPGSKYKNRPWKNNFRGRKSLWNRVVKIMGPVLVFLKCEQCLIMFCFTARPEGKVL